MSTDESERIRRVYAEYEQKGWRDSKWSLANPGNTAILAERHAKLFTILATSGFMPLRDRNILEVGCGAGKVLLELAAMGASPNNCSGVDLIPERIAEARRANPSVKFTVGNAETLPFKDSCFDLIIIFTVFSSVLDFDLRLKLVREVDRVLKDNGGVLWYDFRYDNPNNPHVRGLSCRTIRKLFPDFRSNFRSLTVLPPLARRLGRLTPTLYPLLAQVPFLRTHLLGLLLKKTQKSV